MYLKVGDDGLVVGPEHPQELRHHHLDHELEVAGVHEEVAVEVLEAAPERLVAAHVRVEAAGVAQVGGEALDGGTDGRRLVRDAGLEELRLFDDDESLEDTRAAEGAAVDGAGWWYVELSR